MRYFVTRHPGAIAWAQRQGFDAEQVSHLDVSRLRPGDEVAGTLPAHMIVELGRIGVRYRHLILDLPEDVRGRDLSADEMTQFGARLEEIAATKVVEPAPEATAQRRLGGMTEWLGRLVRFCLHWGRKIDHKLLEPTANRVHRAFAGGTLPEGDKRGLRVLEAGCVAWALFALGSAATDFPGAAVCLLTGPIEGAGAPFGDCGESLGGRLLTLAFQMFLFALFLLAGRWALMVTNEVAESRADLVPARDARARVLVMGLSKWEGNAQGMAETHRHNLEAYIRPVRNEGVTDGGSWQQNARSIAYHLARLETVYVLPSDASRVLFPAFRQFCQTLFDRPLDIRLVRDAKGVEFELADAPAGERRSYENYEYVHSGLRAALDQARADHPGLKDSEICIDVTAGQKTFSIAAGILTLNRDTRFSYVTSTSPQPKERQEGAAPDGQGGEVHVYDARITFTGHLLDVAREG